jgi:hypothetical protein
VSLHPGIEPGAETEVIMSNTTHVQFAGTAFAALLPLGACGGGEHIPAVVPNVEPEEVAERRRRFPSPDELKLCDRRVPAPRC